MSFFHDAKIEISEEIFCRGHGMAFIGLYSYIKYLESRGINRHEIYRMACLQDEDAKKWIDVMEKIGLTNGICELGI